MEVSEIWGATWLGSLVVCGEVMVYLWQNDSSPTVKVMVCLRQK